MFNDAVKCRDHTELMVHMFNMNKKNWQHDVRGKPKYLKRKLPGLRLSQVSAVSCCSDSLSL